MSRKIKRFLRFLKRVADKTCGAFADEIYWRFRGEEWAKANVLNAYSINLQQADFLDRVAKKHEPFSSLLDVGCAAGAFIYHLNKTFPQVRYFGVDINKKGIRAGKEILFKSQKNVTLFSTKADNLSSFPDKSIDIILTSATLMCVAPDKIHKVLKELFRVAKKSLIFFEWHTVASEPIYKDHWVYNYRLLLGNYLKQSQVEITKLPLEAWPDDQNWQKFGYAIEVRIVH